MAGENVNFRALNSARVKKDLLVPQLRGQNVDQSWANSEIEKALRGMADRLQGVEQQVTQSGNSGIIAAMGESGITAGRLVHVRDDSVAFMAVSTDATRPCTHVVAGVLGNGRLNCYGLGHWPVQCVPFQNTSVYMPLWVSEIPGLATDVEPVGADLKQRVGVRMTGVDQGSGLCLAVVKPEFYKTGTSDVEYLDDLLDVDTTGKADGDVITWNGTGWVADAPASSSVTVTGIATQDIATGEAVCRDMDGYVFLADGASNWRYCNGIAAGTYSAGDTATIVIAGEVDVYAENDPDAHTSIVYLSDETPGWVRLNPPDPDTANAKMWQPVGFAVEPRDSGTGKIRVQLALPSRPVWIGYE